MSPSPSPSGRPDTCDLPYLDSDDNIVYFDVQSAEPGTFTVPGVIDLETYEPGDIVETSWIYFKGDPQAGPQPGHPFERPFNNSAKFSISMVRDNDTSTVLREIMRKCGAILYQSSHMYTDRSAQLPPTLLLSGKGVRPLVNGATTRCTSRNSTVRASTTPSAR